MAPTLAWHGEDTLEEALEGSCGSGVGVAVDDCGTVSVPSLPVDVTVLCEDEENVSPEVEAAACQEGHATKPVREPLLSLVTLNRETAKSFDLVRGHITKLVPDLSPSLAAERTLQVTCGRGRRSRILLHDSQASLKHFVVRVRAARGAIVAVDLLDQSSNGTWVNGDRVPYGRWTPLSLGDCIEAVPHAKVGHMLLSDAKGSHCSPKPLCLAGLPAAKPPTAAEAELLARALERDLRCGICADVLLDCLTLVPCGHNFCSGCLIRWRCSSVACPECRTSVLQAVRNRDVDAAVDVLKRAHPDVAGSLEERAAADQARKRPDHGAMLRWLLREDPGLRREHASAPRAYASSDSGSGARNAAGLRHSLAILGIAIPVQQLSGNTEHPSVGQARTPAAEFNGSGSQRDELILTTVGEQPQPTSRRSGLVGAAASLHRAAQHSDGLQRPASAICVIA